MTISNNTTTELELAERMELLEQRVVKLHAPSFQEVGAGGREYDSDVLAEISKAEDEIDRIDEQLYKLQNP